MRPIKLSVNSKETRNDIIEQSAMLKDINTIVRIMPDRSEDERKRVKELNDEAKSRNNDTENPPKNGFVWAVVGKLQPQLLQIKKESETCKSEQYNNRYHNNVNGSVDNGKLKPNKRKKKNNSIVKCLLTNIRSIGPKSYSGASKRDELISRCNENDIDLIFICESWTSHDDLNDSISLANYNIVSRIDKNNSSGRGGGLIIYARDTINNISFKSSYYGDKDISFQSTCIELKMDRDKAIDIHLIYRSPNQDSNESEKRSIDAIVDILNTSKNDTILLGDANMPEICYESYKACPYSGVSIDRSTNYIDALKIFPTNNS